MLHVGFAVRISKSSVYYRAIHTTIMAPKTFSSPLFQMAKYLANALMPCYLHQATCHGAGDERRTRFLDGLRGYASLVVFTSHFLDPFQPYKRFVYGYGLDNRWIFQLPIIRLLYSGVPMVAIFFLISGYALSHKPFSTIRSESWDQFSDIMASAIFRRGIRLFLPTLASTFMVMISTGLHFQDFAGYLTLPGVIEARPLRFNGPYDQLVDWYHFVVAELTNPWVWQVHDYAYDPHLWTIPIEFRASMILFMFIICISRFRRPFRLALSGAFWVYCMWCDKWHVALFITGMCIADVSLDSRRPTFCKDLYYTLPMLVLGLFMLSFPIRNGSETPGFIWLSMITPKYTNWHCIGAMLTVWPLNHSEELQRMFTTLFAGYLGKLSYALYLVHGPALHSFGYGTVVAIWSVFGKETMIQHLGGLFLGFLLVTPVVFWWSDVFERLVDRPSIELARWMYLKAKGTEAVTII